jgi:hypothetical protein
MNLEALRMISIQITMHKKRLANDNEQKTADKIKISSGALVGKNP